MSDGTAGVTLTLRIDVPGTTTIKEAVQALTGPDGKSLVLPIADTRQSGIVWRMGSQTS